MQFLFQQAKFRKFNVEQHHKHTILMRLDVVLALLWGCENWFSVKNKKPISQPAPIPLELVLVVLQVPASATVREHKFTTHARPSHLVSY